MIGRVTDVPLRNDPASRFLPWTVGLQVLLGTLALAAAMLMSTVGDTWRTSLSGTLTVQVPPPEAASGGEAEPNGPRIDAALELLRKTPGIASAGLIPESRVAEILEPWLGSRALAIDLPLPALIDATAAPGAAIDVGALSERIARAVPGATVDDHAVWLRRLADFAGVTEAVALAVILVILAAAVVTVVFTTRTSLAIHRDIVEVLHLIGAQDSYVARQFQVHAFRLSLWGALGGFALGVGAIAVVQVYGSRVGAGLLPDLALSPAQWAVLCALPAAAVLLVVATVGVTVMRSLGRMM
jgi:cell division transport system permease protein